VRSRLGLNTTAPCRRAVHICPPTD
jgi:hypothetical protein